MLLIWGSRGREELKGYVADICPQCRDLRRFAVISHFKVTHLYFIPLGGGDLVATVQKCTICAGEFQYEARRFSSMLAPEALCGLPQLVAATQPELARQLEPVLAASSPGGDAFPHTSPFPTEAFLPAPGAGRAPDSAFLTPVASGPATTEWTPARWFLPFARQDPFVRDGKRNLGLETDLTTVATWIRYWSYIWMLVGFSIIPYTLFFEKSARNATESMFAGLVVALITILMGYAFHQLARGLGERKTGSCTWAFVLYLFGTLFTFAQLMGVRGSAWGTVSTAAIFAGGLMGLLVLGRAACSVCTPGYAAAVSEHAEEQPRAITQTPLYWLNLVIAVMLVGGSIVQNM